MLPISRKVMVALGAGDTMFDQILAAQQSGQSAEQLAKNITQAQLDSLGGAVPPKSKPIGDLSAPMKYTLFAGMIGLAAFMFYGMKRR